MNARPVSPPVDAAPPLGWKRLSTLVGVSALTALAFAVLHSFGVVGDLPLPGLLGLLAGVTAAGALAGRWYRLDESAWRLHLLIAVQMAGVTSIIYAIGWGPTLGIGYVFVVASDLDDFGSRVWRTALGWIVVCMFVGEVAFATNLTHSYIARPYVHGLAVLATLGVVFVVRFLGVKTEDQEASAAALQTREEDFRQLFADNPQPMWLYDRETLAFLEVNSAAVDQYGYSRAEFLERRITDIRPPDDVSRLLANVARRSDSLQHTAGWRHQLKDGRVIEVDIHSHELRFENRPAVLIAVEDVTDRHRLESELRHQALHDALTGAMTRHEFVRQVESSTDTDTDTDTGDAIGVAVFDIDDFKLINDSLGPEVADDVLRLVAERLSRLLASDEFISRLGADVFAIMMRAETPELILARAEALRRCLAAPFPTPTQPLYISASGGLAAADDAVAAVELLRRADDALHRAKQRGRNRLERFDQEAQITPGTRLALIRDVRTVLERGKLTVHYQPVIDLRSGKPVAVEALARCEEPVALAPSVFIPIAEEAGLIGVLGEQILAMSIGQAAHWPGLRVAVNVSPRQLIDPELPERIEALLRIADVAPSQLIIEVTETVLVEDSPLTRQILDRLTRQGIGLAIDDFGSGYAGMQYLQRLPFSEIKIDRSLVDHIDEHADRAALVRALIDMSAALGIDVVAEGIERSEEHATLIELGCRYGQGFLFARPMSAAALTDWLAERSRSPTPLVAVANERGDEVDRATHLPMSGARI